MTQRWFATIITTLSEAPRHRGASDSPRLPRAPVSEAIVIAIRDPVVVPIAEAPLEFAFANLATPDHANRLPARLEFMTLPLKAVIVPILRRRTQGNQQRQRPAQHYHPDLLSDSVHHNCLQLIRRSRPPPIERVRQPAVKKRLI